MRFPSQIAAPALLRHVLDQHGFARLQAAGSSMLPSIRPGDVLSVRRCTPQQIESGTIVLVARGDRLIAHRVVRVRVAGNSTVITTRGDAHWQCDPEMPASQLLGWVDAVERRGRVRRAPIACTSLHRALGIALHDLLAARTRCRELARRLLRFDR